jgi:DNA modification methylase
MSNQEPEQQFTTFHKIHTESSTHLEECNDESVHLVVTSPPYPMIEMWDETFSQQDPTIGKALDQELGPEAFEFMHKLLDSVWEESFRVLVPGGILCVNIGDAVRKLGGHFRLFTNHSRIIQGAIEAGFMSLPGILWRKTTNAPNKFMGSGTLPAGAYITLEHEHILVFRKAGNRDFATVQEKLNRRRSAYFWEERNQWFSDMWEMGGARQTWSLRGPDDTDPWKAVRGRSAAYPFEIPYRLISMFTVYGDTVVDPFWGAGTTTMAAVALGRNSMGWEIHPEIAEYGMNRILDSINSLQDVPLKRLSAHQQFIKNRLGGGKTFKHYNQMIQMPVITGQESELVMYGVQDIDDHSQWEVSCSHRLITTDDLLIIPSVQTTATLNKAKTPRI